MTDKKKFLATDVKHFRETHWRWLIKYPLNHDRLSPEYDEHKEEWVSEQCLTCQYYIKLSDRFQYDWGVCSNPASALDGRIMFEHDGCEHYSFAEDEESF